MVGGLPRSSSFPQPLTFSIVLETENLAQADPDGLLRAIATLEAQTLSPCQANEVLLLDSGDAPAELLDGLCQRYPWLQIQPVPRSASYYEAKMLGAQAATGEIVVYYDSDCVYEPNWLAVMLESFQPKTQPKIQVVAGETRTRGVGLYGTAMAIAYIFPQYSGQTQLQPTSQYFLNNVAFRREFLLQHPIPLDLPLYRGHCVIHAHRLIQAGHCLWRQPRARASHAPPHGLTHFFWRFLLIGYDYYWQTQILRTRSGVELGPESSPGLVSQERGNPIGGLAQKLRIFRDRLIKLLLADWRHAIFLPLSLPIIVTSALLIYIGHQITSRRPHYLVDLCDKLAIEI